MKLHKTTKNVICTASVVACFAVSSFAGGLNTNTNQSVLFLRSVARDASVDVDAPYANPSGTAFMKDGFHLSLNNQTFWQNRSVEVNDSKIFKDGTEYSGETFVPSMPSIFATWHHGNLAISGHFGIIGGGGSVSFDDGIPSFKALMASSLMQMQDGLSEKGLKTTKSDVDISLDATSYIFGFTLGAAYEFGDMFSVYLGARYNYAFNHYEGSIGNLTLNSKIPGVNPDGKMMSAEKFASTFDALAEKAETKEEKEKYATLAKTYETFDDKTSMELDVEQTGWGITPIFGFGVQYKKLTFGAKFEYNTSIEIENDTKKNETPLDKFDDGKKDDNDIPALIAAGLAYSVLDNIRLSVGYHHWFDSKADFSGDLEKYVDDSNEFLFGLEWDVVKSFMLSGGVQVTRYGLSDEYVSDMNINLEATTFGFGFAYRFAEWGRVNVGYFHTLYKDYDEKETYGMLEYSRTSRGLGVGLDFEI